jgi:hypothetical protein
MYTIYFYVLHDKWDEYVSDEMWLKVRHSKPGRHTARTSCEAVIHLKCEPHKLREALAELVPYLARYGERVRVVRGITEVLNAQH